MSKKKQYAVNVSGGDRESHGSNFSCGLGAFDTFEEAMSMLEKQAAKPLYVGYMTITIAKLNPETGNYAKGKDRVGLNAVYAVVINKEESI